MRDFVRDFFIAWHWGGLSRVAVPDDHACRFVKGLSVEQCSRFKFFSTLFTALWTLLQLKVYKVLNERFQGHM